MRLEIRLGDAEVSRLDAVRGLVPRASWVASLVRERLGDPVPAAGKVPGNGERHVGGTYGTAKTTSASPPAPSRPLVIPGVVRASDLVEDPAVDPDDGWPPPEAREW